MFSVQQIFLKSPSVQNDKLIYRDNTCYEPDRMPMEGIGMYEGYTHVANIFLTKLRDTAANLQLQEKIWQILDEASETEAASHGLQQEIWP